jgi:hypothetical protein
LLGVLLFAGCAAIEPQPPTGQAVQPVPAPDDLREQVQSGPGTSDPNETGASPLQGERADETAVNAASPEAQVEDIPITQTSQVDANEAPLVQSAGAAEAGKAEPNNVQPTEPNEIEAAEPNEVTSAPVEPNEVAAGASGSDDALSAVLGEYAEILKTYVREDGLVDYGALRRRRLDLKPLLMTLGALDPNVYQRWSRDEQLAFWINAYNLKMLDIITRNYPIQSSWWLRLTWTPDDIRHIEGIWTAFRFVVMHEEFTLADVERRFFPKTFDDPRVYLALTYACRSSPFLRREPYRGGTLDRQLDEQVKQFLSSPSGLQIDRRDMVVRLSALFKPAWRGKEFVGRYGTDKKFKSRDPETRAVLHFLTGHLPRDDVYFLEVENYTLEYINFDWRLNDTARGY